MLDIALYQGYRLREGVARNTRNGCPSYLMYLIKIQRSLWANYWNEINFDPVRAGLLPKPSPHSSGAPPGDSDADGVPLIDLSKAPYSPINIFQEIEDVI